MMLRILLTSVFALYLSSAIAQESTQQTRTSTLDNLRAFRVQVFSADLGDRGDSLASMLTNLVEMVKKTDNPEELNAVLNYTAICSDGFTNASAEEKRSIAQSINKDLQLKAREGALFAIEGSKGFGSKINVKITAQINGVATTGSYRIFWGYFLGRNLSKLIKSDLSQGSSDHYNNPYDLQIRTPGYICFWLKDEQTNKYYRTSFEYKVLDRTSTGLTINFQPLD